MTSLALSVVALGLVLGAPELHLSSLDAPMPPGENSDVHSISLAAAANEQESFYVRVVNDGVARTLQSLDLAWNGALEGLATAYIVTPDPAVALPGAEALTPLIDPVALAPQASLDLLVSVKLAETAPAGAFSGNLRAVFDSGHSERAAVRMEVFDFIIPDESSLPVLFGLDREAIRRSAGLTEELDDWVAFYDTLAGLRAGFAVWPQRHPPGEMFYDYRDLDVIKAHLAYAVRTAHLPAIEIGGRPGELLAGWPPPVGNNPQDPLQLLLSNIMTSLYDLGWTKPTVLIPDVMPARDAWPERRQALARIARADEFATRLLPGPLHPYFERYTDVWALPSATAPAAISLLQRGLSTVRYRHPAYSSITGSPGTLEETGTFLTEPGDALDGCEYSNWRVGALERGDVCVLEIAFESAIHLEQIAVLWPNDAGHATMDVETAYNPGAFTAATVRWEESNFLSEGENGISLGVFKHPRDCKEIRIRFEPGQSPTIEIAEILFNQDGRTVENIAIEPVVPWLNLRTGKNIWLESKVRGAAWRLLPWFCWQRNFRGILGAELTPEPANGGTKLIATEQGGIYPTVAMLHLLDGLEDYEYLIRYWRDVAEKKLTPPEHVRPGWTELPASVQDGPQVELVRSRLAEARLQMGRLLSGKALVTRNFGP
ncbi:MAG: hypothetical protein JNK74_24165 [Candidatus Hydrogenedentes bacterium]|nr:hypothetical protein [Candidatus Hydrogenedentota bacterium]